MDKTVSQFQFWATPEFRAWADDRAGEMLLSRGDLIAVALIAFAKSRGFEPPPLRLESNNYSQTWERLQQLAAAPAADATSNLSDIELLFYHLISASEAADRLEETGGPFAVHHVREIRKLVLRLHQFGRMLFRQMLHSCFVLMAVEERSPRPDPGRNGQVTG
jgi:hypothetical protein